MFCWCKLREWVWTETGKGDRLGGDSRVGPSPLSERLAPPHSLHRTTRTIPEAGQLPLPACCATVPDLHCLAMPRLPAFVRSPCLLPYLHCPCIHQWSQWMDGWNVLVLLSESSRDCALVYSLSYPDWKGGKYTCWTVVGSSTQDV